MVGVSIEGVGPPARGFSHNPGLLSPAHPVPTQALPSRGSRGPVKADSTSGSSVFSTSVSVSVPETEASGLETQTPSTSISMTVGPCGVLGNGSSSVIRVSVLF